MYTVPAYHTPLPPCQFDVKCGTNLFVKAPELGLMLHGCMPRAKKMHIYIVPVSMHRAGGSNFHVVRPNLVSVLCWVVACVSTLKVGGSGGMLPRENFEIYSLRDGFW